jgi:tripartite-type tricarboxylate transporter receptor subunit TctC
MTMTYNRRAVLLGLAGAVAAGPNTALAQSFPARSIRWTVGVPPGGGLDMQARILSGLMSKSLGQPVVVDNRPGAGGATAASSVAASPPDGYTLISLNVGDYALNPHLYSKLSYDPARDFAMIGMVSTVPMWLLVNGKLPVNNLAEFIAYVKSQPPGAVNIGSAGPGTAQHLMLELLNEQAQLSMTHVPYRGGTPATTDLLGGQVQALFNDTGSTLPHVKSGALKALAVAMPKRLVGFPDIPTLVELGYDVQVPVWIALGTVAGTPPAVIARLNEALIEAIKAPEFSGKMAEVGVIVTPSSSQEAEAFARKQLADWGPVFKRRNIKLD